MSHCQIKASPLFSTSGFSSCPFRSHFQSTCLEMCVINLIEQSSGALAHLSLFGRHQQFDSHVLPSNKHEISSPWHQLTNSASRSPREVLCLSLRVQSSPHMFLGFFAPKSISGNFSFNRVHRKTHLYRWSIPAIIKREEINYYVSLTPAQRNWLKLPITTQLFRHFRNMSTENTMLFSFFHCYKKLACFSVPAVQCSHTVHHPWYCWALIKGKEFLTTRY